MDRYIFTMKKFTLFLGLVILLYIGNTASSLPYNNNLDNETIQSTCNSIRQRTRCDVSASLSPSWCKYRNPFIIPRIPTNGIFNTQNSTEFGNKYKCDSDHWDSDCTLIYGVFPGGVSNHKLSLMYTANLKNNQGSNQVFMEDNFQNIASNMESKYILSSLKVLANPDPTSQTVAFAGTATDQNSAAPLLIDILHVGLPIMDNGTSTSRSWNINRIGQIIIPRPNKASGFDAVKYGGGKNPLVWFWHNHSMAYLMTHVIYYKSSNTVVGNNNKHRFMFYPVVLNATGDGVADVIVNKAWGIDIDTPMSASVNIDVEQVFLNCPATKRKSSNPFKAGNGCDNLQLMAFTISKYFFVAAYDQVKGYLNPGSGGQIVNEKCTTNCPSNNIQTFQFIGRNANANCAGCGFSQVETYNIQNSIVVKDESFATQFIFYQLDDEFEFGLVKLMFGGPPINDKEKKANISVVNPLTNTSHNQHSSIPDTNIKYNQKLWAILESSKKSNKGDIFKLDMIEIVETSLGDANPSVVSNNCSVLKSNAQYFDKIEKVCKTRPQTSFYISATAQITEIDIAWRGINHEAKKLADETNCSTYNTNCIVRSSVGPDAPADVQKQLQNNIQNNLTPEQSANIPDVPAQQGHDAGDASLSGVSLENIATLPQMEAQVFTIYATAGDYLMHIFQAHETLNQCNAEGDDYVTSPSDGNILYIGQINTLRLVGKALTFYTSHNSHYVFISLQRKKWQLDTMVRRFDLCKMYNKDPTNKTLSEIASKLDCKADGAKQPRLPGLQDFLQITTLCLPGMTCPSLTEERLGQVEDGYYNNFGFEKILCEKGNFCKQGMHPCPIGFKCGKEGMSVPEKCETTQGGLSNCFATGLTEYVDSPNGTISIAPYMPPFPASPGMKQKIVLAKTYHLKDSTPKMVMHKENVLTNCTPGEFCSIGSSIYNDISCPAQTYCLTPSDYVPRICRFPDILCKCPNDVDHICDECPGVQYCKEATIIPESCKAGYVCKLHLGSEAPGDGTRIEPPVKCPLTLYCPAGSYDFYPCPAGYYCSDPTVRKICPQGYYCPEGNTVPIKCKLFEVCKEGSNISFPIWPYVLMVAVSLGAYCLTKLYTYIRNKERDKREDHRKQMDMAIMNPARQSAIERTIAERTTSENDANKLKSLGYIGEEEVKEIAEKGHSSLLEKRAESSIASSSELSAIADTKFKIDFKFENLGLDIKGSGKSVLKGVTGEIMHGKVTAVMGPSGAGKSTFMTTLAGKAYYGDQTGTVLINGVNESLSKYKRIVGFVPQEDIMMRDMTVKENLQYSGNIRLSSKYNAVEKRRKIRKCIDLLDLREIRHSRIGDENTRGISGGQRKRVNIGLEMVAEPSVLFLDEPTSGLDSTSSLDVCKALRDIADTGITVITVIHQPRYEIFTMFHDVLLLGKGGQTVYLGPSEGAIKYFESIGFFCPARTNPADFFMDVIAGDVKRKGERGKFDAERLFEMWNKHQQRKMPGTNNASVGGIEANVLVKREQASIWKMFYLFMRRAFTQQGRHLFDIAIDNLFVVVAAFFLGISFVTTPWWEPPAAKSNFVGCPEPVQDMLQKLTVGVSDKILPRASMTLMAMSLAGCASAVRIFGRERIVYFREAAGIDQPRGSIAYFCAKDIASLPQIMFGTFFFQLIFKAIASPRMNNAEVFICLMPVYYCAYGVGMFVSIVVEPNLAQLCGFVFVFVNQLYSGAVSTIPMMQKDVFPLNILYNLSFLRYASENFYLKEAARHQAVSDSLGVRMEDTMDETFGYSFDNFERNLCAMFAWGIFIRIVTCLIMTLKDRTKKL